MKILLVNTPKEAEVVEGTTPGYLLYDFANYPPLGLLSIAAGVDSRHDIKVLDAVTKGMGIADTVEYIKDYKPDILGFSMVSRRLYPVTAICRQVKEIMPEVTTIVGGPHPNEFGMETINLGASDYVMSGYCEFTFPQFVEAIDAIKQGADPASELPKIPGLFYRQDGKVMNNPEDPKPASLDDHPFPRRDLVDLGDYFTAADKTGMTTMFTSRGCPFKCTFCDVMEKKYHYKSKERIVDEMEYIKSLGIDEIHIFDDTFNLNKKRVMEMCEEILRRGVKISWTARVRANPLDREMLTLMKKAGLSRVHAGIESLDPKALEAMKKQITLEDIKEFFTVCNELKVATLCYMILGFPEEDAEYRRNFVKNLMKLKPTYIYINILYPLAKTQLYYDHLESGFYEKDHWGEFFKNPIPNFQLPSCRSEELHDELVKMMDTIHKKFYLSPRFVINDILRNPPSLGMLWFKSKLFFRLMFADTSKEAEASGHHSAPYKDIPIG